MWRGCGHCQPRSQKRGRLGGVIVAGAWGVHFGLAKDVRGSNLGDATLTSASPTQVGVVMGTSGRPLDHRTDIFSLAWCCTLRGNFFGGLVSAILRDSPPSVRDLRSDQPGDLACVIRRCLEKDPRHRLPTARGAAKPRLSTEPREDIPDQVDGGGGQRSPIESFVSCEIGRKKVLDKSDMVL